MSNFNEFEYQHKNFLKNGNVEVKPLSDEGFKKYISDKSYVYHFLNKPKFVKRGSNLSLQRTNSTSYLHECQQKNEEKPLCFDSGVLDQRAEEINFGSDIKSKKANCSILEPDDRIDNYSHINQVLDPKLLITRIPRKKSSLYSDKDRVTNIKNSVLQINDKKLSISKSLINIKNEKLLVNGKSNKEIFTDNPGYEELGLKLKDLNRSIFSHPANSSTLNENLKFMDEGSDTNNYYTSKQIDPYFFKKSERKLKKSSKPSFNNSDIDKIFSNHRTSNSVMMEKRNTISSKSPLRTGRNSMNLINSRNSPSRSPVPHPIHQITKKKLDRESLEKLSLENQKLKIILLEQTDSKFLNTVHLPQISHISDHPVLSKNKLEFSKFFSNKYNPYSFTDKKERIHRNHIGAKFCN